MTTLIVALAFTPGKDAPWGYVLSPDGRALGTQSQATPALLPPVVNGEVVALVPAQALSWHRVRLPKGTLAKGFLSDGGSPRLRAVLEGLLEEHVLDEPAQLHFALAPDARDDAPAWVAVCDRAALKASLQVLESHGRAASKVVPEWAPGVLQADGEASDNTLYVMGTPGEAQILFQRDGAVTLLPLSTNSAAAVTLAAWPADAPVMAEPAVAGLAESLFNRRVGVQQSGQRWLQAAQSGWDLAQFDLVNSGRSRSLKRMTALGNHLLRTPRWKAARWAAMAVVVTNLIGLNAWAWKQQTALDAKRQAVREVLTSTFPGVRVVVDAPVQMGRELTLLRQAAGATSNSDFESLMSSFSASFVAVVPVNRTPTAIEFVAPELKLKGLGLTSEQVTQGAERLKSRGISLRSDGDTVVIRAEGAP